MPLIIHNGDGLVHFFAVGIDDDDVEAAGYDAIVVVAAIPGEEVAAWAEYTAGFENAFKAPVSAVDFDAHGGLSAQVKGYVG